MTDKQKIKRINRAGWFLTAVIFAIGVVLFILNIQGCREGIAYGNNIDYSFWVCDTINTKYNPAKDEWKCTIRCTDQYGNEYTKMVDCR